MSLPEETVNERNAQDSDVKKSVSAAQSRFIDRLADLEHLLATLYAAYGEAFPEMSAFWHPLAREEGKHSEYLKSLHGLLDAGKLLYNLGAFNGKVIDSQVAAVREALAAAQYPGVSEKTALETALSFEKSILESQFYDIVKSDGTAFSVIAGHLSADTHRHVQHVEDQYRIYLSKHL